MSKSISFRGKTIYYQQRDSFWESLNGFEPEMFDVLDKYISPGSVFLDIGAWNGVCSIYASLLGARCHSIEPDPIAFLELGENIEINKSNCVPYFVAISNREGKQPLLNFTNDSNEPAFGNSMSSLLSRYENEGGVDVDTTTLLEFLGLRMVNIEKPDFIKMDAEGAEAIIIPSSLAVLEHTACPLYISFHPFWFKDREGYLRSMYDLLSQIYKMGVSEDDFMNMKADGGQFLLLPK